MKAEEALEKLNRAGTYPSGGWAAIDEADDGGCVVLPFLGECQGRVSELPQGSKLRRKLFEAYARLRERAIFFLRSLEALANASRSSDIWSDEGFDRLKLAADLALYEFGCLADSLAQPLAFFIKPERPDQVPTKSFGALRKWAAGNKAPDGPIVEALRTCTDWYDSWVGPSREKGPRDLRTHHHWQYDAFVHTSEGLQALRLCGSHSGSAQKYNVRDLLKDVTHGLFALLSRAIPKCDECGYCGHDLVPTTTNPMALDVCWKGGDWVAAFLPLITPQTDCG
jgi:hypothetical protein